MGKLIDVDELRKYIGLSERCEDCDRDKNACRYDQVFTRMDFCGWLDDAPEAVVRCKDCKHRYEDDCPMRFVEIVQVDDDGYIDHEILYNDNTKDYGHCDRGERRTE